jgi:hypothetical protein
MFICHRPFTTASAACSQIITSAGRLLRRGAFLGDKFFIVNLMGTHFHYINVMYQTYKIEHRNKITSSHLKISIEKNWGNNSLASDFTTVISLVLLLSLNILVQL